MEGSAEGEWVDSSTCFILDVWASRVPPRLFLFFRPTAFTSPHTAFEHAAGVPIRSSMWETIVALRTKQMGLTFSPASHRGSHDRGLKRRAQWVLYLRLSRPPVPSFVPFFPYLFFFFFLQMVSVTAFYVRGRKKELPSGQGRGVFSVEVFFVRFGNFAFTLLWKPSFSLLRHNKLYDPLGPCPIPYLGLLPLSFVSKMLTQTPPLFLFFRCGAFTLRSHGFCIGHITPEAQVGGPIALVRDGDIIHVDAVKNSIELRVSEEELEKRRKEWKPHPLKVNQGTLYKYVKMVSDASRGCITDA